MSIPVNNPLDINTNQLIKIIIISKRSFLTIPYLKVTNANAIIARINAMIKIHRIDFSTWLLFVNTRAMNRNEKLIIRYPSSSKAINTP